jgi:hypothetical protein
MVSLVFHSESDNMILSRGRALHLPVNPSHSRVLTKRRIVLPSLLPQLLTMLRIIRRVEGIVEAENHHEQPGEGYQNTVGVQGARMMRFPPSKRIVGSHGWNVNKIKVTLDRPEERGK